MNWERACELAQRILSGETGFTVTVSDGADATADPASERYAVGGYGPEVRVPGFIGEHGLAGAIMAYSQALSAPRGWPLTDVAPDYVGGWVDDGGLYLDGVRLFRSRATALYYGRLNRQKAIYDRLDGCDVAVPGADDGR